MAAKKKLTMEDVGATEADFENAKIRISILLPIKDLAEIKRIAAGIGKKYQPMIQEMIHSFIRSGGESRVITKHTRGPSKEEIETMIEDLLENRFGIKTPARQIKKTAR